MATRDHRCALPGLLAMLAWALVTGCNGEKAGVPLQPIAGKVLVDGQPAKGVEVRLHPTGASGSIDPLTPFAVTGEDGRFTLGTYRKEDGVPEGRYRVTLFWPDRPPGPQAPVDRLGGAYNRAETSGLEAAISAGQNELRPFEVKKAVPPPRRPPPRRQGPSKDRDGVG